jgi:hypothetical protein
MTHLKRIRYGCLFLALLLLAAADVFPSEKKIPRQKEKEAASAVDSKILLSLRIAKARKARRGTTYYMSVARQRKNRGPSNARPPSSER